MTSPNWFQAPDAGCKTEVDASERLLQRPVAEVAERAGAVAGPGAFLESPSEDAPAAFFENPSRPADEPGASSASPSRVAPEPPKPFDFEPAIVESARGGAGAAGCDALLLDDGAQHVPSAHRRWLVRSAAVVGAASAVGLLALVDMFLRTPAMATDARPASARPAATAAPVPVPALAPAGGEPAPLAPEAEEPRVAETVRPEAAMDPAPTEPEEPAQRRLPALAPRVPAAGRGQTRSAAHMRVAGGQLKDGLFRWAQWNYLQAVKLAPKDPEAHFGLALAATELRRDTLARAEVDTVLALDPRHPLAHVLAGYLAQLRGDRAGARAHYQQYLEIEPEGPFAPQVKAILADPAATF